MEIKIGGRNEVGGENVKPAAILKYDDIEREWPHRREESANHGALIKTLISEIERENNTVNLR